MEFPTFTPRAAVWAASWSPLYFRPDTASGGGGLPFLGPGAAAGAVAARRRGGSEPGAPESGTYRVVARRAPWGEPGLPLATEPPAFPLDPLAVPLRQRV